jgi:ubiquinone/menaquinone biosynthesis C-methylase UbiE
MIKNKNISKVKSRSSAISYGAFINPEKIISLLDFNSGMKVADCGSGTGYFTFPIAKKIGNGGIMYALDIVKEKLESVESQAKLLGISNIFVKRASLEEKDGSGLEKESVDWVVLVNMLYENKNKKAILEEAKRVLKKEGRVLAIEWNEKNFAIGPDKKIRLTKDNLEEIAKKNGLGIEKELEISAFHYGLILVKHK